MNVFFDLETLTVNKSTTNPSELKTTPFSVAYIIDNTTIINIKPNIEDFLNHISRLAIGVKQKNIKLYAHNASKYDAHFILADLLNMGFSMYLNLMKNINTPDDSMPLKQSELKNNECLELRYKSSNQLGLIFKYNDILFEVIDTFPKTYLSIEAIGKRLHKLGYLKEKNLKTQFDYQKYDLEEDLNSDELRTYSNAVFNTLTLDELEYIKNDVLILQKLVLNFDKFFDGFSVKEFALNGNVINKYTSNKKDKIATIHILNRIYDGRADNGYFSINYGDYKLNDEINLFSFLKNAYRGGVCFYNDNYLDIEVNADIHSYDINSSYPSILYKNKVPHSIINYFSNKTIKISEISYKLSNTYSVFTILLKDFRKITEKLKQVFKKINSSYYKAYTNVVTINSLFLDELILIYGFDKDFEINIVNCVTFDLKEWGAREYVREFYEIKENSKRVDKKKLVMNDLGQMVESDISLIEDQSAYTDLAKILLNSIYGASGISDYVDFFYHNVDGILTRCENGIKNIERNIISSLFVTSFGKFNLLFPLKDLTNEELNTNFLYCDTDSLYIKKDILKKVIKNMDINENNLGAWKCESKNINKFKIINHKIYAFYDKKVNKITCKACGVSKTTINEILKKCNNNWDYFNKNYFFVGRKLPVIKSILNKYGTISIYSSEIELQKGYIYQDPFLFKNQMIFVNSINELYKTFDIDTNINTSESDLNNISSMFYTINGASYSKNEIIELYRYFNRININLNNDSRAHIEQLIKIDYLNFFDKLNIEPINYALVCDLVNTTKYNYKKLAKFKYTVGLKTNHKYIYLKSLYKLQLFNLKSLKNREYDILKQMLKLSKKG